MAGSHNQWEGVTLPPMRMPSPDDRGGMADFVKRVHAPLPISGPLKRQDMSFEYGNHRVRVYRQSHPQYPPFIATAERTIGDKVFMFNVEGQSMQEAAEKAKKRIDEMT